MADAGCEILFLIGHLAAGDRARDLRGLMDRLAALGHAPRALCVRATGSTGIEPLTTCPGLDLRWRRPWAVRGLRALGEPAGRPRVLHVLEMGLAAAGLEIAERWDLPYLLAVEDYPARDARFRLSRGWCRGLVAADADLAEVLRRDYGIPPGWIHTIPRGTCPPETMPAARPPGRVPVVGAAGALAQGSGFATFLSAARRVIDAGVDAEFLVAGEGEDEIELRRRAEKLSITDRITFAADRGELNWWEVLDVYCQTSVTSTVGRPLAQAMAHGVPSIASDVGGMGSLVADGRTGLRVPAGDPGALARAILRLLADRPYAQGLGDAGRDAVLRDHAPDREAHALDALYRRLTEPAAPQPPAPPAVTINPWRAPARAGVGTGPLLSARTVPGRGPVPRPSKLIS